MNRSLKIFHILATGLLLLTFAVAGCFGKGPVLGPYHPPPLPPAATTNPGVVAAKLYILNGTSETVDIYAANANGGVTPISSLPALNARAIAGDTAGNLYLGFDTATTAQIQVFAPATASTPSTLTRTIQLPDFGSSGLNQISTMTVDTAGNVYVASISNTILVYGPTATGAATPLRSIAGPLTTLAGNIINDVQQMAVDAQGDLYVAEGGGYAGSKVVMFSPAASGNVEPTLITSPTFFPTGVDLDVAGNIYITQSSSGPVSLAPSAVYVFAPGSVAGATPLRSIVGSNTTLGAALHNIHVDAAGNIFVMRYVDDIAVFSATANGNVAPASALTRQRGSTSDTQFFLQ